MKPTYEELERERNELAAQVERLRSRAFAMLMNRTGLDEWYDLEKIYNETPPSALSALKAQWQAEAIEQSVKLCRRKVFDGPDLYSDAVLHYASELRQRALESGNENV